MLKQSRLASVKNIYGSEAHRLIYAEISYLKKRIHLVEGERKANYESNEEQLKQNEIIIHGIREKNTKLKKESKEIMNSRDNYFYAIISRIKDEKQNMLYRGKTFEETVDILECKIGDLKNKLNLLQFDKKLTRAEKISIIKIEKEVREALIGKPEKKHLSMQTLRETENSISTMQLRITEAENIRSRYKLMIETLATDNLTKHMQITEMENKIHRQLKEIATTRSILNDAIKARRVSRIKLSEVEDLTLKDYGVREQKLFQCRNNLKEIRNKMEQIGTKLTYPRFHMIHRDSSLAEGFYLGVTGPSGFWSQETKSQNIMDKVYKCLKDMTGESDPANIIIRFEQQRTHSKELELKEKEVRSHVRKERLRKRFLQDKLNNLKFCGGIQWQDLDKNHEKVHQEIYKLRKQETEAKALINDYASITEQAIIKLNEICTQTGVPSSSSPHGMLLSDRVVEILLCLISTLEHVLEEQEIFLGSNMTNSKLGVSDNELSEASGISAAAISIFKYDSTADLNLLNSVSLGRTSNLGDMNMTITDIENAYILKGKKRNASTKSKTLEKKSDSSGDEEAVTRMNIKRQSQVLVESKTRKGRFNAGIPLSPRPR